MDDIMAVLTLLLSALALTSGQLLSPMPVPFETDEIPPPPLINEPPEPVYNATYWLAMSDKVRPGSPFHVSAKILKGQSPVSVQLTFRNVADAVVFSPPAMEFIPGDVQTKGFDIPMDMPKPSTGDEKYYWSTPQYTVTITGKGQEVNFEHKRSMSYEEKYFSTFIQTDKGMYKPGQKVMFRVLSLFPDMTPVVGEPYDIYIKDAGQNRIRQWLGVVDNKNGLIQLSLKLADEVPTGDWSIVANIYGKEEIKTFTVDNYVLPRYEVEIQAPSFGLTSDTEIKLTVKATYTFGQPVTGGTVDLEIKSTNMYIRQRPIRLSAELSKDGDATFSVTTEDIYRNLYISKSGGSINITANVTEALTGRVQSSLPEIVEIHRTAMKLKFIKEIAPEAFKPGLPFTIYTEVRKPDDSLFTLEETKGVSIYFNVTYEVLMTSEERAQLEAEMQQQAEEAQAEAAATSVSGAELADFSEFAPDILRVWVPTHKTVMVELDESQRIQTIPADGWISLTFQPPPEATSLSLRVWASEPYKDVSDNHWMNPAASPSDSFLRLVVGTDKPKVGSMFDVTVEATEVFTSITYQIYSKGVMLESVVVEAPPGGSSSLSFGFMVTRDMTPSISLVAFYVRDENHEVVVDALTLSTDGLFHNPMTVEFSKDTAKPGEMVDVIVKAEQGSMVYLLSADKSAVLLKGGNDITQDDVIQDMAEYTVGNDFGPWRYMFICGWGAPSGGTTAGAILESAGVVFLSDLNVYDLNNGWDDGLYPQEFLPEAVADADMSAGAPVPEDSANKAAADAAEVVIRKFFPEVWLWTSIDILTDSTGQVNTTVTVPDTITSWVTTGFSLHPDTGLSIVEQPTTLIVSKPMFVNLDLPLTIVKDEDYCFTATVFNYHEDAMPITVTLEKSDKFSNMHIRLSDNKIRITKESIGFSYYVGTVPTNGIRSVKYCVTPTELGDIPIRVKAESGLPGVQTDIVERIIVSKPEGVPRATSIADLADLSVDGQWNKQILVDFPENSVEGSQKLEVSVSGSLLGAMFDNLEELLKRPYGCGEQNMLNFAPNIFLLQFYMNTDSLTEEIQDKAVTYMLEGYQKENTYQHKDGGFSAFGDKNGATASTWLTAFVLRCYALAQQLYYENNELMFVDPDIMGKALRFLTTTQVRDGSFVEYGTVFHKEMQGASANKGVSLTAYTVIALYEAKQAFQMGKDSLSQSMVELINSAMNLATGFWEDNIRRLTDPYDLCLTTYAMHLINAPSKETAFSAMEMAAKTEDGLMYWSRPKTHEDPKVWWSVNTEAINIEMTAYALLVYSMRENVDSESISIVRWLTRNKGPNAGFHSTQDTIIGLQALSGLGVVMHTDTTVPITLTVSFTNSSDLEDQHEFVVDKSTERLLQIARIPYMNNKPTVLNITAKTENGEIGSKSSVVETTLRYNILKDVTTVKYILDHRVAQTETGFTIKAAIRAPIGESRSMSILEVEILPGHFADEDSLREHKDVSRVEVKGDVLVIYFDTDKINDQGVVLTIDFFRPSTGIVTKPQPRTIKIYDYYEPQYEDSQTYYIDGVEEENFCDAVDDVGVCTVVQARKAMQLGMPEK